MRIVKTEYLTKKNFQILTDGLTDGEILITNKDGFFHADLIKVTDRPVEGIELGKFQKLRHAVLFAKSYENSTVKYEYYCQFQKIVNEGGEDLDLNSQGALGWELCAISPEHMYIYKRIKLD